MTDSALKTAYRYWRQKMPSRTFPATALLLARADVANGTMRYPRTGVYHWGRNAPDANGARWVESLKSCGLRFVGYADEINTRNDSFAYGLDHTGYFTSENGDNGELLRGVVLQFPARDGCPRYLVGYEDPNNEDTYRVSGEIWTGAHGGCEHGPSSDREARDAARAADQFAERAAEQEREYLAAWQAGARYADLGAVIPEIRRTLLQLIKESKLACRALAPNGREFETVRDAIRTRVAELVNAIRDAREQRDALKNGDAENFYWYGRANEAAFNEGAGEPVFA